MYIQLNQRLRAEAGNEFEKDFFKLMNNAVYGKTCENQKKWSIIKLVTKEEKVAKLTEMPTLKSFRIFNENLAAFEMQKIVTFINKPFYVGFSVLDLSKLLMYRFHYDYIKKKYQQQANLLFTDTDSLMYEIQTEDAYADFWKDKDLFDWSEFASPYNDKANAKVVGKMKDETHGNPITEFIGLKPKMYSYTTYMRETDILKESHRVKGVAKGTQRTLVHAEFQAQLDEPHEDLRINRRIQSKLHKLYTLEVKKRCLCAYDDKRLLLEDGIKTLAFGHYGTNVNFIDEQPQADNDMVISHYELRRMQKREHEQIAADYGQEDSVNETDAFSLPSKRPRIHHDL